MRFCFIDEAGDSQAIQNANHNVQPLLVISGLFVDGAQIRNLTHDFISLKRRFFPGKFSTVSHNLDILIKEIKGDELRKIIRDNDFNSTKVQTVLRFLDELFVLLWKYEIKLVARVWVKAFGVVLNDKSIYTLTTQHLCIKYQGYLDEADAEGMVIADYRDPARNSYVAHSIFTQKYKNSGDKFPNVIEIPTFSISNNHAILQMADVLSTTLLFPIAAQVYCKGFINTSFVNANYDKLRTRYKKRLRKLQYHLRDSSGKIHWGVTVKDQMGGKSGVDLFQ